MTYKEAITQEMTALGKQPEVVFIGQGLVNGDRVYGTLDSVPTTKCLELPCAENLHIGTAIGLALLGYRPIVVFQRMDFILVAASAIINDLALWPTLSGNQFELPVVIRAIVGSSSEKFVVGKQHNKDLTKSFQDHIWTFPYRKGNYETAGNVLPGIPRIIVEYKDMYDTIMWGCVRTHRK